MKKIETSVTIKSPVEKIWQVLTDFEKYPQWNPFIKKIEGVPTEGTKLKNTLQLEGQKPQIFSPVILKLENNKEFRWLGHLFFKGLFDGEHYFKLEPLNDGQVKLIHGEQFSGILSKLILTLIEKNTLAGFKAMNKALKNRVEQAV